MKPIIKISIFSYLFLSALPAFSQSSKDGWELKRDKGNIKVYVRDAPDSKIKELKFTTTVNASLTAIAAILGHVEGYDEWVYASIKSERIKQVSDTEFYYYTEIDFPWPLSNRDLVLYSTMTQDPKTLALVSKTTSAHWMKKNVEDLVRIEKVFLQWTFTPLAKGEVKVDYFLKTDPGGMVPAWMINLAADQGPLQTMIKFKEAIEKEKYRNAKLAFVKEKK